MQASKRAKSDLQISGASHLMHGCTPEVVEEYVNERRVRPEVSVVFDSADVVEDEAAVATVVVTHEAREHHDRPEGVLQGHLAPPTLDRHSHVSQQQPVRTCKVRPWTNSLHDPFVVSMASSPTRSSAPGSIAVLRSRLGTRLHRGLTRLTLIGTASGSEALSRAAILRLCVTWPRPVRRRRTGVQGENDFAGAGCREDL